MKISTTQKVIIAGLVIVVLALIAKSFKGPASLGVGGPSREERIISGQEEINEFKLNFDGGDLSVFNNKLDILVSNFEANNEVHVVRSSVYGDGPIIVK